MSSRLSKSGSASDNPGPSRKQKGESSLKATRRGGSQNVEEVEEPNDSDSSSTTKENISSDLASSSSELFVGLDGRDSGLDVGEYSKNTINETSREVLATFKDKLTDNEKKEIRRCGRVYFLGNIKNRQGSTHAIPGHLHADGRYNFYKRDHINYRYELLAYLGEGGFGKVIKCYDHKEEKFVAIKCNRDVKDYVNELRILKFLRKNDPSDKLNVVHLLEDFKFRQHIFLVFNLMADSISYRLQNKNKSGLSLGTLRGYCFNVLTCLKGLRDLGVVHCDVKPGNLVLEEEGGGIRVIDFGLSCLVRDRKRHYVQTRPYRAPEVVLKLDYGPPIDMWSLGCTMAEMYKGSRLFTGRISTEHIAEMCEILGEIPENMINECSDITKAKHFLLGKYLKYCTTVENGVKHAPGKPEGSEKKYNLPGSKPLKKALNNCKDTLFVDFIQKCLAFDPELRMTPEEGLGHPWMNRS